MGRHLSKGPECQAELSSSVSRGQWGAREEFKAGEEQSLEWSGLWNPCAGKK